MTQPTFARSRWTQGRFLQRVLLLLGIPLALAACATGGPVAVSEKGSGTIQGYLDYSYDKNSVLFNTADRYSQTVFFDTIYPFDPALRYNNAEPLVRYRLDHKPFSKDGVLMVALADLRKIYAPYFAYSVDTAAQRFTVTHHFFGKRVAAGVGSRAPRVEYTKHSYQGSYALASPGATVSSARYATTTDRNAIDKTAIVSSNPPNAAVLDTAPVAREGLIYVPAASFMRTLGKTIVNDAANSGYLAVSNVGPADTSDDLFKPGYNGTYQNAPITARRISYMNGVLNGTITKGNLWNSYYFGEITEFSGTYDANGKDVMAVRSVDRILPYRVYIPKSYDARVPSKFTFLLHGGTGNENAPFERPNDHLKNQPGTMAGVVTVEDFADRYNYIVLSPNGWTRGPQWGKGPGEQAMLFTLEAVKRQYNIDPGKMFITGNSAGGAGAMNFAIRHARLFRAMAPTAPGSSKPLAADLKGAIIDMPTLLACYTADITVFYAAQPSNSCQPWYHAEVKNRLRNVTFVTVENGHHSYGAASLNQMTFDFFDRVLDSRPAQDIASVRFAAGRASATVTAPGGATSSVSLGAAPVNQNGTVMVALDDLARIYGAADFKVYDVYAYNRAVADLVAVKTIKYNNVAINLKTGDRFLRVGGAVHAGDTTGASTTVPAGDPSIDPRAFSVATTNSNSRVYVPVVELMRLFGKTVIAD